MLSGLSSDPDRTKAGFHDRALASFMTGVELTRGKVHVGISVDQVAAQALGKETQFASLELATERNEALGGLSYQSATNPLPFEPNPRRVFERLFGEGGRIDPAASAARDAADQSSLDTVVDRIAELKGRLGPSDRRKLDEYLQSIRDVERRIQVAMRKRPADLPNLARPAGVPDSWPEHVKIMFDLQALALQADLTRVWTFMYAREASSMTFPHLGISMGHHEISHHNFEADKLAALAKINVDQSELFAYFLTKLDALKEGNCDAARSLADPVRQRPERSHGAQPARSADHRGGRRRRAYRRRPLHRLSGRHHPVDESISDHARQGGCADREARRQHRQAEPPGGIAQVNRTGVYASVPVAFLIAAGGVLTAADGSAEHSSMRSETTIERPWRRF